MKPYKSKNYAEQIIVKLINQGWVKSSWFEDGEIVATSQFKEGLLYSDKAAITAAQRMVRAEETLEKEY